MFEKLELTRMAQALAAHAGSRMGVIARNVANADVPGYKARTLPDFKSVYQVSAANVMRSSRTGHLGAGQAMSKPEPIIVAGAAAPNGNGVTLELEMVNAAEARQQHDMALSIYRSTSDIMKLALGRGR